MFCLIHVSLLLLADSIIGNEAARILAVYPTPSISHQVVFRPLTNELVKRGHEVVVITADPEYPEGKTPKKLTEIDVHDISYRLWREKVVDAIIDGDRHKNVANAVTYLDTMTEIAEKQYAVDAVQDIIHNENNTFDLILTEAWTKTGLGFSHVIKVPVIEFSSLGAFLPDQMDPIGTFNHPVIYPHAPYTRTTDLTFWERLESHYNHIWYQSKVKEAELRLDQMNKKIFGQDTPPISELKNNIHMIFLNVHPLWDNNRPVPPGILYIPRMHHNAQKELPKELKSYLDASVHGVIYISFGTNVNPSLLPPEKVQIMIKAFSTLPYDVLWKWNDDVLPGKTENIRISKWLPQSDLLRHPKIKVFITQGGLQSTDESIAAGVPLIGVPMLGDQWLNTEKYVQHKIGLKIDLPDLEVESFRSAIRTVVEDKSYRDNVARFKSLVYDEPMTSLERAVWWTEHVLRHGGARHLRAPAANMPWARYYELDLALAVLGAALTLIVLSILVIYKIHNIILNYNLKCKVKKS